MSFSDDSYQITGIINKKKYPEVLKIVVFKKNPPPLTVPIFSLNSL